jgi:hypothetical protein
MVIEEVCDSYVYAKGSFVADGNHLGYGIYKGAFDEQFDGKFPITIANNEMSFTVLELELGWPHGTQWYTVNFSVDRADVNRNYLHRDEN